jgi:hypothetical protein
MPDLLITRAVPNPAGKDRLPPYGPTNEQLNKEWMEFRNASARNLRLDEVVLMHFSFDRYCSQTGVDDVMNFKGLLQPEHSVRVHTGDGETWQEGTIWHLYARRSNYLWNNACGDTATLRLTNGGRIDWASYDPHPPEGVVLNRVPGTNQLSAVRSARTA